MSVPLDPNSDPSPALPSQAMALQSALCVRELRALPGVRGAMRWLEALSAQPNRWLLESALAEPGLGNSTFLGADPYLVLSVFGSRAEVEVRRPVRDDFDAQSFTLLHDPLDVVRAILPPPPARTEGDASGLDFVGGAVGYLGYELAGSLGDFALPALHGRDELGLPDLLLLYVDRLLAIDVESGRVRVAGLGFSRDLDQAAQRARKAADELLESLPSFRHCRSLQAKRPRAIPSHREPKASLPCVGRLALDAIYDQAGYAKAVTEILDEIAAGNVYQANLTHRLRRPFSGDALSLYEALCKISPAPFAAFLELPDGVSVVSSSPERFVRVDASGNVESRPIKGTRPRGRTPREDARLSTELANSEKDRAENLMIVDLVRNDLGRVCEVGSLEVSDLMEVKAYATVFQLVSTIRGRLRPGCDASDLLRATFPPGSMTGAPKVAAMALLDRLEPVRRGVYSGALGYFDVRGGLDLSVVIRAMVVARGQVHLHVGGGVVADSDPLGEYRETLDKARALRAALEALPEPTSRWAPAPDTIRPDRR